MIVALYIFLALIVVGALLWLIEQRYRRRHPSPEEDGPSIQSGGESEEVCCGMHITCERDSLLSAVSPAIEYFDDEELDQYRGRGAGDYSADESEQFRDILLTLLPDDIAPWARSLQLRGIELPADVRDELLLIVSEARRERATSSL